MQIQGTERVKPNATIQQLMSLENSWRGRGAQRQQASETFLDTIISFYFGSLQSVSHNAAPMNSVTFSKTFLRSFNIPKWLLVAFKIKSNLPCV